MCLSIPAKIIEINGDMAKVLIGKTVVNACLQLIENIKVGDYVLVHTGFAIEKISEEEAIENLSLIKKLQIFEDD
ncbi:MAG: HypC/HybG/HupF family hydrogenase formation chaperone [Bacteroidota bacterium]